ncbi:MAG: SDR family oxidoreductase [Gammaproteobacteria bacterium]|jgi:NAD(P)-dependent dehydrogenase (short-subunit alcohol dehydrogenase family)|nr:SDR family oxidoreductase [Gammaproteobacteria bacterium]
MIPATKELLDFSAKTVVVTGASQGIGAGIARRFAEAGANVVVHYRGSKEGANKVVESISKNGGHALALQAELSNQEECKRLVTETVKAFGGLDVLVNNAGVFPNVSLMEMSLDDWRAMYSANVETAMLCTQAAAHQMKEAGGGAIVNMGSTSALNPAIDHSHYSSAKAAVVMFTRSAAQELGQYNIRVNTVSPGLIAREGLEENWPDGVARWQKQAPLGRMGEPEDVADGCLFLASPAARWISGQNLVLDGGMLSSMIY